MHFKIDGIDFFCLRNRWTHLTDDLIVCYYL